MKKTLKITSIMLGVAILSLATMTGCSENLHTSGDFVYRLNEDAFFLEGLSEQGKQKETIVVPKEIDGYEVTQYTYQYWLGYRGNFESENLKQIYIIPSVSLYRVENSLSPNLRKIVLIGTSNHIGNTSSISSNINVYFCSTKEHVSAADETGCLNTTYYNEWLSNCNYFYNYAGAENDGYYWSDNYDYGEKITYVPQNPEREGYIFGGWFKEPECVNVWNFDTDALPEAKYNEEGEALYQETRLYAKWYQQSDQG